MKLFSDLTKLGITIFVVLAAISGYATGFESEQVFNALHFIKMIGGVFLLSSGSLALNQVQEYKLDAQMPRTAKRPVASGQITPMAAGVLAGFLLFGGCYLLYMVAPVSMFLGVLTVVLYNVVYTYVWKPKWIYAAVPGAIPGALPVTIGYAAVNENIFSTESIYLFLILFLWQMPHFWALAIRYKDDYREGGIPTLPVALGMERTLYQMGMYTFAYVGCAVLSPAFYKASWFYLLLVVPTSAKLLYEFYKFNKTHGQQGWLKFFMWINVSVLLYLIVPALDKWNFLFTDTN
ncbi:MAG: protoheme IX farnesyltransferase [Bdellovibrionaceae bacterium]|nr:protoheme IX farnesyltransferase [Pseudobdellovibrionaceae bacterium]